ncbi:MAG TPA: secretin N-terminal domain-containing protein, partial [Verrucomicrobiales bacterium]|nr:secretin N-terminal domain-containing protein [Verrucomicrobiales bacterium]
MSRPSTLLLPLLLTLPFAVMSQDNGAQLSPALRTKLLAQNTVPPVAPPASAGVPPTTPKPATAGGQTPAPTTGTPAPATGQRPPRVPRPNTGAAIPPPAGGATRPNQPAGRTFVPPGRTEVSPAPRPVETAEGQGMEPDPNNKYGDIAFINADINDVITKYEEISHRHVLRSKDLQGNVTVYANPDPLKPFTQHEAEEFMRAALGIQGFVIQRYNDTIDKIVPLAGQPPGIEGDLRGFPLYTKEEDLPEEDKIINFVLTLKHLPVIEGSQVLSAAVPVRQWAKYVAVPSANSIFVQEYVSNIRTLLKVAKTLDLPPVKLVHEWVELERASAEDVQAILDQILQAQTKGTAAAGTGFRSISPAAAANNLQQPGGVVPASSTGASSGLMPDGSSVIVKADPRTNRVFINGPIEHVTYLKKLIREFDEPSRVKNLLTQQLRYIAVNDFFNTALTALEATGAGQAGTASAGGGGGGGGGGRNAGGTGGGNRNFGGNDFGGGGGFGRNSASTQATSRNSSSGFNRNGSGGTGGGLNSSTGASGNNLEAPMAQTVGKTLLISDPRTNSLIVSGPPDSIQRVSDLVKEMDRRPYQVHISAVIAQMAIGNNMETSVDLLRRVETINLGGHAVSAAGFFRSGSSGTFIDPTTLINNAAFPTTGAGLNLFGAFGDFFNAYASVLSTTSRSKLLAKPHITVANNEIGSISSGTRVPIPSNQQSTVVAGGTTSLNSSVEYEEVVLQLDVQPLINSKNEITLNIDQVNDSLGATVNISGNEIPNID